MLTVIIIMTVGIVLGYFIRHHHVIINRIDRITNWAIYLLLFLIGISVGTNERVVQSISTLGWHALIITASGVLVSAVLSLILYRLYFKGGSHEK